MINLSGKKQMQTARVGGLMFFTGMALILCFFQTQTQIVSFITGGLGYFLSETLRIQIAFSANLTDSRAMFTRIITSSITKAIVLVVFFIFVNLSGNFSGFFVSLGLVGSMISHRLALFRRYS